MKRHRRPDASPATDLMDARTVTERVFGAQGPIGRNAYAGPMCRNITTLRGLEPAATDEEIEAAARQYVRKVSGVQSLSAATKDAFELAVAEVTAATTKLLNELPDRKQPPTTVPPLRRPEVRARMAAKAAKA
jgi:hypothetical protein